MDSINYDNLFTDCLKICDNIDDNSVNDFFPKLDQCLEISKNVGFEKVLFQKSLLGLVRRCRRDFLTETKMSFKDVTEIANYFSEYIREMMHLDGIDITPSVYPNHHESNIDKRSSCNFNSSVNYYNFFVLLIILTVITCIFCFYTCWICSQMKRQDDDCSLILPKELVSNLALTCQEIGLNPSEMKVLREKTCFDREYESIVNKYLQNRGESLSSISVNEKM